MTLAFSLPSPFWFPMQIFLKFTPPTQYFCKFHFPLQKKGRDWQGVENYVFSSKKLYDNI